MSKELKITKERVLEASKECPDAKGVLEKLFPEVFREKWEDITESVDWVLEESTIGFWLTMKNNDKQVGYFNLGTDELCEGYKITRDHLGDTKECPRFRILKKVEAD